MVRPDDHAYDELIRQVEEILRDDEKNAPAVLSRAGEPSVSLGRQEIAALEVEQVESSDGYVEVRISEDRMTETARFFPPHGGEGRNRSAIPWQSRVPGLRCTPCIEGVSGMFMNLPSQTASTERGHYWREDIRAEGGVRVPDR
jgi:hypothetical protein